jgi:ABC-2 type transport system permease protein
MKPLIIASTNLRRFFRDRANVFFVFLLPLILVLVMGTAFSGAAEPRVGVVTSGSGPIGDALSTELADVEGLRVVEFDDPDDVTRGVERGELAAAVVVPAGASDAVAAGDAVAVAFVARPDQEAQGIKRTVEGIVTQQGLLLRAAAYASQRADESFATALATAEDMATLLPPVEVAAGAEGEEFIFEQFGRFGLGATSQLVLFMFLTSLTGSAALIQTRRLGLARRMISTPTPVRTVLVGEGLGRLAVALIQGGFIFLGTLLLFGVDWGDPVGAVAVLLVFGLVGSGAAMLMGAVFTNDQQASGLGVLLGLGLAALGGCMMPLAVFEAFSPGLYQAAHVTPHAWAIRAFDELILQGGTIVDILPFLGVLLGFAAVLYALAVWRLRVALTT